MKSSALPLGLALILLLSSCASSREPSIGAPGGASPSPRSGLASLEVRTTIGGAGGLSPAFTPAVREYSVRVNGDIFTVEVVASLAEGAEGLLSIDDYDVESGMPYRLDIEPGITELSIVVRAPEGSPEGSDSKYTLSLIREDVRPLADKFLKLRYTDPATGLNVGYRLFVPEGYDPGATDPKKYPLVLFLHGAGEVGDDNESQILGSQGALIWTKPEEQAKRPCFVLAPQSPSSPTRQPGTNGWTSLMSYGFADPFEPEKPLEAAYALLLDVMAAYPIDPARVYATGLSMGGFGTFAIAAAHPETFAAIVPICGGMDPAAAGALAGKAAWIFHAEDDFVVGVEFSRDAVRALKAAGGAPIYTEYPTSAFFLDSAHASWIPAYANAGMREWLVAQRK